MLIRSMMQAVYQPDNVGHFGLGYEAYTHFTSPIRRYPDLLVHRGIRHLIRNSKHKCVEKQPDAPKLNKAKIYPYNIEDMLHFGEHASMAERRADAAGYSVVDWLKCEYMRDKIGDEFVATVTSVTSFGLFVELNDIFVEGLVHVTELSNDYYRFDPIRHCLEGERSGKIYRLGDSVEVKVVRVDLDEKKIDLQMLGGGGERGRVEPKSKRGSAHGDAKSLGKEREGKAGKKNKSERGKAGRRPKTASASKSAANNSNKASSKGAREEPGKAGKPAIKPRGAAKPRPNAKASDGSAKPKRRTRSRAKIKAE
jgi:ribonuclease R